MDISAERLTDEQLMEEIEGSVAEWLRLAKKSEEYDDWVSRGDFMHVANKHRSKAEILSRLLLLRRGFEFNLREVNGQLTPVVKEGEAR